jgi:hypothetical protein
MRRLLAINLLLLGSIPALAQHPTGGGAAPLGLLVFLALAIFAIWILIRILKKLGSLIGSKPQRHREPQVKKELRHPGPTRPGKLIFISYRREDSSHITGRIYDELCAKFGEGSVFKDVNKIPIGVNFKEYIQNAITGRCAVLIAVIGPHWSKSSSGQERLRDEDDHLRIEIETALQQKIYYSCAGRWSEYTPKAGTAGIAREAHGVERYARST